MLPEEILIAQRMVYLADGGAELGRDGLFEKSRLLPQELLRNRVHEV